MIGILFELIKQHLLSDEPNRQELFQTAIQEFINHSSSLTQTARLAANGTSCRSKSTIETINITASQVVFEFSFSFDYLYFSL